MSNPKPIHATVRHVPLNGRKVPDILTEVGNVCSSGSGCTAVQNDAVASQALAMLLKAVTSAQGSLTKRLAAAQALLAAIEALNADVAHVRTTLVTYESAVNVLANGDATVIKQAGLPTREPKPLPTSLGKVSVVHSKPGKSLGEAIINWPKGPGATGYAIEVNFTPQNPSGTWTALMAGTGRRRVVKAPTPGAQFLVRVASLGSDGTQSDWSDAILATAL